MDSYRQGPNPAFDTEEAISVLGTGEALVSFLDGDGAPEAGRKIMRGLFGNLKW